MRIRYDEPTVTIVPRRDRVGRPFTDVLIVWRGSHYGTRLNHDLAAGAEPQEAAAFLRRRNADSHQHPEGGPEP